MKTTIPTIIVLNIFLTLILGKAYTKNLSMDISEAEESIIKTLNLYLKDSCKEKVRKVVESEAAKEYQKVIYDMGMASYRVMNTEIAKEQDNLNEVLAYVEKVNNRVKEIQAKKEQEDNCLNSNEVKELMDLEKIVQNKFDGINGEKDNPEFYDQKDKLFTISELTTFKIRTLYNNSCKKDVKRGAQLDVCTDFSHPVKDLPFQIPTIGVCNVVDLYNKNENGKHPEKAWIADFNLRNLGVQEGPSFYEIPFSKGQFARRFFADQILLGKVDNPNIALSCIKALSKEDYESLGEVEIKITETGKNEDIEKDLIEDNPNAGRNLAATLPNPEGEIVDTEEESNSVTQTPNRGLSHLDGLYAYSEPEVIPGVQDDAQGYSR